MKTRILLTLAALTLVSNVALAQDVSLTDEASGVTLTLSGDWVVVEDDVAAIAANEEGCLMALAVVPEADAEAAMEELESFLGEIIEDVVVVEADADEEGFGAVGTGSVEGEAVEWMLVAGAEEGWFAIVFAGATEDAEVCAVEMGAILEAL